MSDDWPQEDLGEGRMSDVDPDTLYRSAQATLTQQADRIAALEAGVARLREALEAVLDACDQGRMVPRPGSGVGGMTVEANIRGSIYTGVPAWPIEEARAALTAEGER